MFLRGWVQVPTGGTARELPEQSGSRLGEIPGPTVKVRMEARASWGELFFVVPRHRAVVRRRSSPRATPLVIHDDEEVRHGKYSERHDVDGRSHSRSRPCTPH